MEKTLTEMDYAKAASILGCDTATIKAVAKVESAGSGFLPSGLPKILFEAHIFSKMTQHKYDTTNPDISSYYWNKRLYKGGEAEHGRLAAASALDPMAAMQSCSWGQFQIMGFNFQRAGYTSIQEFVEAMHKSEGEHLVAFCRFVKSMGLDDELQRRDWVAFARAYNGPGFAQNGYDTRLAMAFGAFNNLQQGDRFA